MVPLDMFGFRSSAQSLARMENALSAMGAEQALQKQQIQSIEAGWQTGLENVNAAIERISARIEEHDKPKTSLGVSAFSAGFVAVSSLTGVAVFFVQSSIRESTLPITQRVASLEASTAGLHEMGEKVIRSSEADARSAVDRADINRRVDLLEANASASLASSRERYASLIAGSVEVETQFKALTGLVHYLWLEVLGKPYPVIPRESPGFKP